MIIKLDVKLTATIEAGTDWNNVKVIFSGDMDYIENYHLTFWRGDDNIGGQIRVNGTYYISEIFTKPATIKLSAATYGGGDYQDSITTQIFSKPVYSIPNSPVVSQYSKNSWNQLCEALKSYNSMLGGDTWYSDPPQFPTLNNTKFTSDRPIEIGGTNYYKFAASKMRGAVYNAVKILQKVYGEQPDSYYLQMIMGAYSSGYSSYEEIAPNTPVKRQTFRWLDSILQNVPNYLGLHSTITLSLTGMKAVLT